jgi:UDP-3-O-[3-hydroxymyristoyl] glucosamine N-acyltransferase
VQIAHNVRLGARSMLASQSGIAGSTTIGDGFRMGGAASVAGHLRLGKNVSVAAKSGVTKDVPDGMTVAGFPARPMGDWRRDVASSGSLTDRDDGA